MIPRSMLALNDDSTVYHLGLHPEQLANTVILVGDPERVSRVSDQFDVIHHQQQCREFVTHTGEIRGLPISVVSTGIGTSNIDIVLNELDALKNIDLTTGTVKAEVTPLTLLRLGTCGAVAEEVEVDELVVSQFALGVDAVLQFYQRNMSASEAALLSQSQAVLAAHPVCSSLYAAEADATLAAAMSELGRGGITLTCSGFYGPQYRHLRVPLIEHDLFAYAKNISHADYQVMNLEMETAMIYGLGGLLGHRCCSVSSVVFNRITQAKTTNALRSVDSMIERALSLLTR